MPNICYVPQRNWKKALPQVIEKAPRNAKVLLPTDEMAPYATAAVARYHRNDLTIEIGPGPDPLG